MRAPPAIALGFCIAIAASSCTRAASSKASADIDLQRDLQLAGTTTMKLAMAPVDPANFDHMETAPSAAPRMAARPRRANTKVNAPSQPEVSAISQTPATPIELVGTTPAAPVSLVASDPVATLPRALGTPATVAQPGGSATNGTEPGTGGIGDIGPIVGVVIRGGGVDGDHCEPHGRGRTPGVYLPPPGGIGTVTRFPVIPRSGRGGVIHD